jgi:hypothetical protein
VPVTETVTIPARVNGPPGSANGGYACGLVAAAIGPAATVRLVAPPPLDVPLLRTREPDGSVRLERERETIATGHAARPSAHAPLIPTRDVAARASERYAGRDPHRHPFPTCFVCGPLREDGLRIFPGPAGDDGVLACVWRPGEDLSAGDVIDPCFVWAALDCPSGFACMPPGSASVLATMTASLEAPVRPGHEYVITAWPISSEGRKHRGGATITDAAGAQVATAEALWITLREPFAATGA